jgi:phosphopantothenoylcysteine decarboxylase / phosphopantothenate---cysteine ligase
MRAAVSIQLEHPSLRTIQVNSALEMDAACCKQYEAIDIAVFAAAVADYRPEKIAVQKLKNRKTVLLSG